MLQYSGQISYISDKSIRPTERKYSKNLKITDEWKLINRREDETKSGMKKTWLSLTEFGKLCVSNDYKPDEYRKLFRIGSIIIFRANQGSWKDDKGNDPLT